MKTEKTGVVSDVSSRSSQNLEPVILEFQHGSLKPQATPLVNGHVFAKSNTHSTPKKQNELVTVCKVDGMAYRGTVEVFKDRKTFLALRNKKTNKVQLVEVSSATLLPLFTPPKSSHPMLATEKDETSSREQLSTFHQNFGGLKGQRIYDQAKRLEVKAETVKANLEEAVRKAGIDAESSVPETVGTYNYLLPPCNRQAIRPSDVYQESDFVNEDDLSALEVVAETCLTCGEVTLENWKTTQLYSPFFLGTLQSIRNESSAQEQKIHRAKLLIYTEALIKFSKLKAFAVRRKDFLPEEFPLRIRQKILNTYAPRKEGSSDRQFGNIDRERCVCHIIILSLLIENFTVDLKLLSSSLQTAIDKLVPLVRVVGAHCSADKTTGQLSAVLLVPLAQPPKMGGMKRKRATK